jgi:phosphatidate cytidylyltransferase
LAALRSRRAELERRAEDLEDQARAAQGRLAALASKARQHFEDEENTLVATLVPWAREEAVTIVDDARRRAAELSMIDGGPLGLRALGQLVVGHFELQERLVRMTADMVSGGGPPAPALAAAALAESSSGPASLATGRTVRPGSTDGADLAPVPGGGDAAPALGAAPPPLATGARRRASRASAATAAGLGALFLICYSIGPAALVGLAVLGAAGCALEAFALFQRAGFRPATPLGVAGAGGAVLATYWRGTAALQVVLAVVLCASLLWYLARVTEAPPVVNVAITVTGFAWVGLSASFSGSLLQAPMGPHLFLGAVVPAVAAGSAAWLARGRPGSRSVASGANPSKTWRGFVAGGTAALLAGAVIGRQVAPWGGVLHGLELGLLVAIVAPGGSLVYAMVKSDLRSKGPAVLLPGNRGFLDYLSSLLFVLPAAYFLATVLHIVK